MTNVFSPCFIEQTGETCTVYNEDCPRMIVKEPQRIIKGVTGVVVELTRANPPEALAGHPSILEDDVKLELYLGSTINRVTNAFVDNLPNLIGNCANDFVAFDDEPITVGKEQYAAAIQWA